CARGLRGAMDYW
nr:immunoglobulin heavy chain junction region [Mus musculus]